jgi:hypothetical protein
MRYILACTVPLAVEQPAVRAPSPSFGRVRDRQAIRGPGARTEPAAGLPCFDLLLAPPVKLVVVGILVDEEFSLQARQRFTCKSMFSRVAGPGFEPGTP